MHNKRTTYCLLIFLPRYYIKGDKIGIYDIFADNLPGLPDNIRASSDGGYWVGIAAIRKWPFNLLHFLGPYPSIRKIITKVSLGSKTR